MTGHGYKEDEAGYDGTWARQLLLEPQFQLMEEKEIKTRKLMTLAGCPEQERELLLRARCHDNTPV